MWGVVAFVAVAVNAFTSADSAELRDADLPWLAVIGAGSLAQIFLASLVTMMPVVIGGGPAAARVCIGTLETGASLRVVVRNAAILFIVTTPAGPAQALMIWWLVVLATFVSDIVLLAIAGMRQVKARGHRPQLLIQLQQTLAESTPVRRDGAHPTPQSEEEA